MVARFVWSRLTCGLAPSRVRHAARVLVRALLWVLVVGCAAWAGVRGLGWERGYPLVALMAFTPYVAAVSVVVALAAAAWKRWSATVVAAVAAAVLVVGVVPRGIGGELDAASRGGPSIRVATVNLERARASVDDVVELVRRERVDVLTLQEVDAEVVRRLEAAGLDEVLPERVVRLGRATHGTALYARMRLRARPAPVGMWNAHAVAVAEVPRAAPIEVVSVHPPAPSSPRRTRAWARDLSLLPDATPRSDMRVLAGDFNATLDHAALRRIVETGYRDAAEQVGEGLQPTWPVGRLLPPVTIDHVLVDRRCGVGRVETHEIERSDHRAIVAEIVLAPEATS